MLSPISLIAPPPKLSPADKESTMVIDIFALGAHVEMITAAYLTPYPAGLYLRDQAQPVMLVGETYYQINGKNGERHSFVLTDANTAPQLHPVNGEVYDSRDKPVVSQFMVSQLSPFPNIPVKGMEIVKGYIKKIINTQGHWPHGQIIEDTEDLLQADFLPEWLHNPEDAYLQEPVAKQKAIVKRLVLDKLVDSIEAALYEMRNQLIEFIGKDKWVMHFVKFSKACRHDVLVEKTINYKVYDWDRRMASGIWTLCDEVPTDPIVDEKTEIYQQTLSDMIADKKRHDDHADKFGHF